MGSSLKFCLLAEGKADLYPRFGATSEWDTAAGQAVLEAAGGHVTRMDGHRLRYNCRESLINGDFVAFSDPKLTPSRSRAVSRARPARTTPAWRPAGSECRIPLRPRPWSASRRPRRR